MSNKTPSLSCTLDMHLSVSPVPKGQEDVDGLSREIDDLLSKELKSLSIQQRIKVQEEVHGVANLCPDENPAMIEEALQSLQKHLNAIHVKHVYDQLSPNSYVHTREWRLKFLRCELYDSKMAAERLVRFTEYMHQEYDLEVLERPLRLSDLGTKCGARNKEVMDSFKSGHTQLLPFRDRSGRRVIAAHLKAMSDDAEIRVGSSFGCCSSMLGMTVGRPICV
jgi:predicted RNase H-like nuclease (RuvC/YqgF family)